MTMTLLDVLETWGTIYTVPSSPFLRRRRLGPEERIQQSVSTVQRSQRRFAAEDWRSVLILGLPLRSGVVKDGLDDFDMRVVGAAIKHIRKAK